ncbi:MAG: transposase [Chlamydiota bacterium]
MLVRKSFRFRLRPTKKQARALQAQLDECRWLYNDLLAQRKLAHEELDISLTKYQQSMLLPLLKIERTSLAQVHSQVLQNVVDRLDKAFRGFFRRCKAGEKPGFPRFRGMHRYNSFCYPQTGFSLVGKELKLSKLGSIRIKMHRSVEGEIKTCTLRKNTSGEWDVSFSCEVHVDPLLPKQEAIGIDVGLEHFATLSNGQEIANPRFFKRGEKALAKAQRKLSKLEKGTRTRRRQGKVVAKIHERISNQRKDFCHKESRKIVAQYQYICVEDLDVKKMIGGSFFAKSIMDASWNQFRQFLTYKAAEAGRKLGLVNPAYTTQDCHQCGNREKKKLSEREHCCSKCGYRTSRDLNAAQNILALGLDGLGAIPKSLRL